MANFLSSPEDFTTTWTTINNAAINSNAAVAPDGTTTADRLLDDNSGGTGSPAITQTVSSGAGVPLNAQLVFSVFMKPDQLDWLRFFIAAWTTPANSSGYFDGANGVVGTIDAGFDGSGIIAHADGWYRPYVSYTLGGSDTTGVCRFIPADADGDSVVDLDGTSSVFIWGAVLEEGSEPSLYTSEAGIVVGGGSNIRPGMGLSFGKMGGMGHG